jgi:ankyrin repeat protein
MADDKTKAGKDFKSSAATSADGLNPADSLEVAQFLIEQGAKPDESAARIAWGLENRVQWVAEHLASQAGQPPSSPPLTSREVMDLLLAKGAKLDPAGEGLPVAPHPSNTEIVKILLAGGAKLQPMRDFGMVNKRPDDATIIAAIEAGKELREQGRRDLTAEARGDAEAFKKLLKAGADINVVDGNTPPKRKNRHRTFGS